MNRDELQRLAGDWVQDAELLLTSRRWRAAYYVLGYAVECALKACISRQFREYEVPDKKLVDQFYTHNLVSLLNLSGIKAALERRRKTDEDFAINWKTVLDWDVASRYHSSTTEKTARDLHFAVTDPSSGVLPWLRTMW